MVNSVSLIYSKLDMNMMSWWHMSEAELGWYGAAVQIAVFTLILTPLLGGAVLLHGGPRARRQSTVIDPGSRHRRVRIPDRLRPVLVCAR